MAVDNSENDTSRSEMLLLTSSTCLILAWISVSLRVWVRAVMIKSFGWDDSLMVLALVRLALLQINFFQWLFSPNSFSR